MRSHLEDYTKALTKANKSVIILNILNEVRSASGAEFVKLDASGNTIAVDESKARINISQALRDELNESYKSSRQQKQRKRRQIKRDEWKGTKPPGAVGSAAATAGALSALSNLGDGPSEAASAVAEAAANLPDAGEAELIRAALKLLAPKG